MDFHSLSRKQLQTLCKKNKIPANITNVAMADALSALPQVEGLDEILNPAEADAGAATPGTHLRTASRTSARKAIREETQSSKVSTRAQRGTRAVKGEGVVEQENKDSNVPVTPAVVPSSKRRAPAVSTRRKKEAEMPDNDDVKIGGKGKPTTDVSKTPAATTAPRSRTRGATAGCSVNTRRSVRLLGKDLSKMSLMDKEDMGLDKIDDVSEEVSTVSQQTEDTAQSAETEKESTLVKKADELEVSSLEKSTDNECESHDSVAEVNLVAGTENELAVSTVVTEKTDESEVSSLEKSTEDECQSHDSVSEVKLVAGTENDVGAELKDEPQQVGLGKDNYLEAEAESNDANLKLEGSSEMHDDSNEVLECCDDLMDLSKSNVEAVNVDNEAGHLKLEGSGDSFETKTSEDALLVEASEDASMEHAEQNDAIAALSDDGASREAYNQDVAALSDSLRLKEDDGDNQVKNIEAEYVNVEGGNYREHFESTYDVDEKASDEKDLTSPEGALVVDSSDICSSGEHQEEELEAISEASEESMPEFENKETNASSEEHQEEELDAKSEPLEEFMAEIEKKDSNESSDNFVAVMEVSNESSADVEQNVILETPILPDVDVHEAEDLKNSPEKLATIAEAAAKPEESKEEHAEDIMWNATSAFPPSIQQVVHSETVQKITSSEDNIMLNVNMMKENLTADELKQKSLRELRKMMKKFTLDDKPNSMSKTNNIKEVERKRTALQALPENRIEAQNE